MVQYLEKYTSIAKQLGLLSSYITAAFLLAFRHRAGNKDAILVYSIPYCIAKYTKVHKVHKVHNSSRGRMHITVDTRHVN